MVGSKRAKSLHKRLRRRYRDISHSARKTCPHKKFKAKVARLRNER